MTKPKHHSCKVGTQPALIIIKRGGRIEVGRSIQWCHVRDAANKRWSSGLVTKVNDDGYFFLDQI